VITYPHHSNYITRTIVEAANSEYIKGEMTPCEREDGYISVMILMYNANSPFKYEVVVTGGLVLRFGNEAAYPQLPDDIEVTISMVNNYCGHGCKVSSPTHESWQSFCTPQRMSFWRDYHGGLKCLSVDDEFVRTVGVLIETVHMIPTVLKVYTIRMKVEQLEDIERGYPRSKGEGKGEENPT
jgi:hypothetical protein